MREFTSESFANSEKQRIRERGKWKIHFVKFSVREECFRKEKKNTTKQNKKMFISKQNEFVLRIFTKLHFEISLDAVMLTNWKNI